MFENIMVAKRKEDKFVAAVSFSANLSTLKGKVWTENYNVFDKNG